MGTYSVADHLEKRAFVADLLLYDRLVVPVPAADDLVRWEKHWNPERQHKLLEILGAFAEPIVWAAPLREQFDSEWSPTSAALDIDESPDSLPNPHRPYELTRRIITAQLRNRVIEAGDVRGVAVYAKPDHFDREWKLSLRLPFVTRTTQVERGALREVMETLPAETGQLAKLVVTKLVVPDDGRDDYEVLTRTVDLLSREDVSRRRAAFHELVASLESTGASTETIVGEVEDLLDDFNELIRRHRRPGVRVSLCRL